MKKKQYISPATEVVTIGFQPSLLAGSLDAHELNSDQSVDISTPGEKYGGGFGGREDGWTRLVIN